MAWHGAARPVMAMASQPGGAHLELLLYPEAADLLHQQEDAVSPGIDARPDLLQLQVCKVLRARHRPEMMWCTGRARLGVVGLARGAGGGGVVRPGRLGNQRGGGCSAKLRSGVWQQQLLPHGCRLAAALTDTVADSMMQKSSKGVRGRGPPPPLQGQRSASRIALHGAGDGWATTATGASPQPAPHLLGPFPSASEAAAWAIRPRLLLPRRGSKASCLRCDGVRCGAASTLWLPTHVQPAVQGRAPWIRAAERKHSGMVQQVSGAACHSCWQCLGDVLRVCVLLGRPSAAG